MPKSQKSYMREGTCDTSKASELRNSLNNHTSSVGLASTYRYNATHNPLIDHAVTYLPAVLKHNSNGWYIEYSVFNPAIDQMERKRLKINVLRKRFARLSEFRVAANEMICTINARLAGGWTPFGESDNSRYYTPISLVLDLYLKDRARELRSETTMRSYKSFAKQFGSWIDKMVPGCKMVTFNKTLAVRYMDDYLTHVSARTYNNMIKMARAFFSWSIEKCYANDNPFANLRTKKADEKQRTIIPAADRQRIRTYYEAMQPEMVIVCEMVYTSLIRPIEITRLRVDMLHLDERYIDMPQDITKNSKRRVAPLSDELCRRLADFVNEAKPTDYIFSENWRPGTVQFNSNYFTKSWTKMRKALGLPLAMQLYSLRDTGIFDKIKSGIDPLTVMQAADHHDLAMTTRYANHFDPNMVRIISEESPDF